MGELRKVEEKRAERRGAEVEGGKQKREEHIEGKERGVENGRGIKKGGWAMQIPQLNGETIG